MLPAKVDGIHSLHDTEIEVRRAMTVRLVETYQF